MNQMPISEYCIYPNLTYNLTITGKSIHTQSQIGISTQNGIQTEVPTSLVILVTGIQDLYISKYKYIITLTSFTVQHSKPHTSGLTFVVHHAAH